MKHQDVMQDRLDRGLDPLSGTPLLGLGTISVRGTKCVDEVGAPCDVDADGRWVPIYEQMTNEQLGAHIVYFQTIQSRVDWEDPRKWSASEALQPLFAEVARRQQNGVDVSDMRTL